MSSLKYWVWLSEASGVGKITALKLLRHFGSPESIFNAGLDEFRDLEGIKPSEIPPPKNRSLEPANKILAACAQIGCRIITIQDAEYPDRLRNIYDPPIILYIHGTLPAIDDEPVVAIVGTRDCTPYGINAAEKAGYLLARSGLVVVTGLARGIDSAATRGALRGEGRVIGVIGSGLDVIYPPDNKELFESVANTGAVLSEYPPGMPPIPAHFPSRNRILSGLSLGVAVIEAPKRSGALITAARALEQGRDVFALPGNVDARSCEGSNALLREGAIMIRGAEDIISEYIDLFPDIISPDIIDNEPKTEYIDVDKILSLLDGDEHTVASALIKAPLHVDEISAGSGLPASRILTALTMLEIQGFAKRDINGNWKLEGSF